MPARRQKVLVGAVVERLAALLREAAERIDCEVQFIAILLGVSL